VISAPTPYFALFDTTPSYAHLQVFGCACYPTTSTTAPYKLAPRSCQCVFLRYSSDHKGYRCLDLTTNRLLISRRIVFDESSFPFASSDPPLDDLDSLFSSSLVVRLIAPRYPSSIAGTLEPVAAPCTAPTPQPTPHAAPAPPPAPRAAPTSSSTPRAASASRFTEPPLVYKRQHPALTPEPSRVGSSVYHPVAVARDPRSTHPMVTRRVAGVTKPIDRLQHSVATTPSTLSLVPTSVHSALADPH
jgi:hypothetical protein